MKKTYQKPEILLQGLVSREEISAGTSLQDWLAGQADLSSDAGLVNAIETYQVTSLSQS